MWKTDSADSSAIVYIVYNKGKAKGILFAFLVCKIAMAWIVENFLKNLKKGVDKRGMWCYSSKAVGAERCGEHNRKASSKNFEKSA